MFDLTRIAAQPSNAVG